MKVRHNPSMERGYIIFDRIDLHVEVPVVPFRDIPERAPGEPSAVICERVIRARNIAEAIGYRNLDRGDWAEREEYKLISYYNTISIVVF